MPPGLRKSGIPEATETPAPVKKAMDWHSGFNMSLAKLVISTGVGSLMITKAKEYFCFRQFSVEKILRVGSSSDGFRRVWRESSVWGGSL
jgi:hypothetical protein